VLMHHSQRGASCEHWESAFKGGFSVLARSSSQLAASTRMNVIPFPPHANLVAHGMPVCRLGSGGKSSKFKMALSKKQLLLLVLHVVIVAKSTKKTYQIFKKVLCKTNIPNESTIK
jgi:hypothetical protein